MAFKCDIVTPDREVFQDTVTGVILPAHDGQVGLLTNRAPMLVRLGTGTLTVHTASGDKAFTVSGGVAQMKDNKLTVLTESAKEGAETTASASA